MYRVKKNENFFRFHDTSRNAIIGRIEKHDLLPPKKKKNLKIRVFWAYIIINLLFNVSNYFWPFTHLITVNGLDILGIVAIPIKINIKCIK